MEAKNPQNNQSVDSLLERSSLSDAGVEKKVTELLERETFRQKTKQLIVEHTDTVTFMEKVQKYANEQIDKRLFKNTKVMFGFIVSWLLSLVATVVITLWLGGK